MTNTTKTIPILKKDLNEFTAEISGFYKTLGNKLLLDAANPVSEKNVPEKESLIHWQKLRDERSVCTNSIFEIKTNAARLLELGKFRKEAEETKKTSIKKIEETKAGFLTDLYKNFLSRCPNLFSEVMEKVHPVEAAIDEMYSEITTLEKQKEKANFFSRIGLSGKVTAQKSKIKKAEKNISSILVNGIEGIQSSEEIKTLLQEESFPDGLKTDYNNICSLYNSLEDSAKRITMIDEETEFINSKLANLDAQKNSGKRISTITAQIKKIDLAIDKIVEEVGLNYANEFFNEEGKFTGGENFSVENLGVYSEQLHRIGLQREKIAKTAYNIEYCETLQKIKTEETRIENLNRIIKNSEAAIESATKKIEESKISIINAQNEISSLTDYSQELFAKFADEENS